MENKFKVYYEFNLEGKTHKGIESAASWFLLTQTGKLMVYGPTKPPHNPESEYTKLVPLFFTNCKDKDKNEIYDGDIIEFYHDTLEDVVKGCVNRIACSWYVTMIEPGEQEEDDHDLSYIRTKFTKLLGNKYENPELLEKK